jgi:hypothetical protein
MRPTLNPSLDLAIIGYKGTLLEETPKGRRWKQPYQIKFRESRTTISSQDNSQQQSHHTRWPNPIKRNQRESRGWKVNKTKGPKQSKSKRHKGTLFNKRYGIKYGTIGNRLRNTYENFENTLIKNTIGKHWRPCGNTLGTWWGHKTPKHLNSPLAPKRTL